MVSRKYYYDIDLNGNSLVNAAVESVTGGLPENAKIGSIIYRTDDDTIYQKLKDGWKPISSTDKSSISEILKNIEDLSKTAQETAEILETKADKSDIVSLYRAKGSVASYKDLPETAEVGDVYDALDTSMNYVWTGDRWDELGAIGDNVDLSNFYTKSETDSALSNKVSKSGDTMTGMLTSEYSYIPFRIRHTGLEKGVILDYIRDIQLVDKNNAEMGTMRFGGDSTGIGYIDLIARNYQGTAAHCKFHVEPDGSSYLWTPSWKVGKNDNSEKLLTIKMANSLPSLVHTTGNETVAGTKTFTSSPTIKTSGKPLEIHHTGMDYTKADGSASFLHFYDKNGVQTACIGVINEANKSVSINQKWNNVLYDLGIKFDGTNGFGYAPTTPSNATSKEIATANWVNTKLATKQATMSAGTGISLSGATINHSNSITANTSGIGSTTKVPVIKYDAQGHITECTTATIYPPTTAGTSGQIWQSNGSGTGAWQTLDTTPTADSKKAVTSGGIKTALDGKADLASAITGLSVSGKVITYTKGDGSTGTITTQDTNTTYSAGTGITISSNKINHSNSVTANTSGVGSATAVPIIKYDAQGHITECTTATIYPPTTAGTSGQIWVSDGSGVGAWKTPSVSPSNIFSTGTLGEFTRDTWIGPEKQDRFLMIRAPHQNLSLYMKTSFSGGQTKVYQSKDNYDGNGGHTISVLMPKGAYWKVVVDESMASGDNYYWINTSIAWELS